MRSLRSVRLFSGDPVSEDQVREVLEMATKAPNGANAQAWRFIVIRDPSIRREAGRLYLESLLQQTGAQSAEEVLARPGISLTLRESVIMAINLEERPPVLILVCGNERNALVLSCVNT